MIETTSGLRTADSLRRGAVLCVSDDNGHPAVVVNLIQRVRLSVSPALILVTATAMLMSSVLLPIAVFSLLRISGRTMPAYDRYRYPAVTV